MWDLAPSELQATFAGAETLRAWWYELALYTAWHTAAFASQAMSGKLKPWAEYRARVVGNTARDGAPPVSWQARKAERQRQLDLHRRHLEKRRRRPHG